MSPSSSSYTPQKYQKTRAFPKFSGGRERPFAWNGLIQLKFHILKVENYTLEPLNNYIMLVLLD